jgi:hypothetical protein
VLEAVFLHGQHPCRGDTQGDGAAPGRAQRASLSRKSTDREAGPSQPDTASTPQRNEPIVRVYDALHRDVGEQGVQPFRHVVSRARQHEKGHARRCRRPQVWQQHVLHAAAPGAESLADTVEDHCVSAADDDRDVLAGVEEHEIERSRWRWVRRVRERQQPRDSGNAQRAGQRKRSDARCQRRSEEPPCLGGGEDERMRRIGGAGQRRPERRMRERREIEEPIGDRGGGHGCDRDQDERHEYAADDRDREQIHGDPRERHAAEPRERRGGEHQPHRNLHTQGLRDAPAVRGACRGRQHDRAHRGERQPESGSEHGERIEREHHEQRRREGLRGGCMPEHRARRIPRCEHDERALRRYGESREQRIGRGGGKTERSGKALARQARRERHRPPEAPPGGDRQHGEQRDVQPGDRDQVGRSGGVEDAPLLARHAARVSDGEGRDQRGGVAVGNSRRDPLGDSLPELGQRLGADRNPFVQPRVDYAPECVDALAEELPLAIGAVRIAARVRRIHGDHESPPVPGTRTLRSVRPCDPHSRCTHRGGLQHPHGRIAAPADLVGDRNGVDRRLDERALTSGIGRPPLRELVSRVKSRGNERERSARERNRKRWQVTPRGETRDEQEREARPERRKRR